ncbi:MAG: VWA domain-containing protein [Sphingomonas sp.]|jgi:Ca-activated chloride channel family protein|uniref:vWA domain-containing protein n=1 Tax=Sphingomonas sp. TaxID=28214 RepID=UPI0035683221
MRLASVRNLGLALAAFALPLAASAQDASQNKDDEDYSDVVVTGMKVRQGGAQDIKHFRSVADEVGMPRPESLTAEGLMGEHDLTLPVSKACAQLFCLVSEAMPAALPGRDDRLFVGLGFASNIDEAKWRRAPVDLIAVIDKSGSMSGEPLALVRASLRQIVEQMRNGDRLGIVLYGDTAAVYLQPTDYAGNREALLKAIDSIESAGSTYMEAGLKVGYGAAFAEALRFSGNTRMMLFTDEQPNVGRTDAESFMTMASDASKRGIGLTTIGVGVQFDASLATKVSSVRGGNLFFIANDADVKTTFEGQFDTMVSELAHDLQMTMKPAPGYRISGVFGVPDGVMEQAPEGAITITVPTVFLSTNGGGIFATLAKSEARADLPEAPLAQGAPLMEVSLGYHMAANGAIGSDRIAIAVPGTTPSAPLRQAHLLIDEYLAMRAATIAFHRDNNPKRAFALLDGLSTRLRDSGLPGMAVEEKLAGDMRSRAAFYAGYAGELPKTLKHLAVVGNWEIVQANGFEDLHRGDRLSFTGDREMLTYRKKTGFTEADETEGYEINERDIHLVNSRLVMRYDAKADRMVMSIRDDTGDARLALRRLD